MAAKEKNEKERNIWLNLRTAYDDCIENLQTFRTTHILIVADYILAQQKEGGVKSKENLEGSAGGKGTGGTEIMKFLKPVRDNCGVCLLASPVPRPEPDVPVVKATESEGGSYMKSNGCSEDIDLYRGAAYPAGKMLYTMPVDHGWDVVTNHSLINSVLSYQ